jgi:hypothetical protein
LNATYIEIPADWARDPNNADTLNGIFA